MAVLIDLPASIQDRAMLQGFLIRNLLGFLKVIDQSVNMNFEVRASKIQTSKLLMSLMNFESGQLGLGGASGSDTMAA